MASYLYKPGHPFANENGFVEKSVYYANTWFDDKGMTVGNQRVRINYNPDGMEPLKHMALPFGSAPIDSKSKYRKITREMGCVEVGDQTHILTKPRKPIPLDRKQRREDIKKALYQHRNGQVRKD